MPDNACNQAQLNNPYYLSPRAWVAHLSLMAELPYPSWALMPSICAVVQAHVAGAVICFGWADTQSLIPLATWVGPLKPMVYKHFLETPEDVFDVVPIQAMRDSKGRFLQMVETMPGYEQSPIYKNILSAYNARWGISSVISAKAWLGFLTLYRQADLGPYTEEEWQHLASAAEAISHLDEPNLFANLPAANLHEAVSATILLRPDGNILSQSPNAHNMLFLAQQVGMRPPQWARDDWHAMPESVVAAAQAMFQDESSVLQRKVSQQLPWGLFEFSLEKMQTRQESLSSIINITISHREPQDIALAKQLWGWAMSPQEKRILIASTRNASLEELAQMLNISVGTLKNYANELLTRFGAPSRQALISKVLASSQLEI